MSQMAVFKPSQSDRNLEDFQLVLIQLLSDVSRGLHLPSARIVLLALVELLLIHIDPSECRLRLLSLQASFITQNR